MVLTSYMARIILSTYGPCLSPRNENDRTLTERDLPLYERRGTEAEELLSDSSVIEV